MMEKLILECIVRSVLIAGFTAVALYALRVKTARVRHSVWSGVVMLMLLLPVWTAFGPKATLRLMPAEPAPEGVTSQVLVETAQPDASQLAVLPSEVPDPQDVLIFIYLSGLCAFLLRLAIGTARARMLMRRTTNRDGRLVSDACATPITVGWLRPAVILPAHWTQWPQGQLDAVLAHEGEHAKMRDPLMQWLGLLNRAIFWFHPLAWWLDRHLSELAEEACDDAVLAHGHDPLEYSGYLLELARSMQVTGVRVDLVGMAMPGVYLPRRIRRIAAGVALQRISRVRLVCLAMACVTMSTVLTVGAIGYYQPVSPKNSQPVSGAQTPPNPLPEARVEPVGGTQGPQQERPSRTPVLVAQARPATPDASAANSTPATPSFTGTVMDPTGAVVPRSAVTLTNTGDGTTQAAVSGPAGTFSFQNVTPGNYSVTVKAPGFKTLTQTNITLAAGEVRSLGSMFLQLGSVSESLSVTAKRGVISTPAPEATPVRPPNPASGSITTLGPVTTLGPMTVIAPSAAPATAKPIRVGGNVQPSNVVFMKKPAYPVGAQQDGVEGTVKLAAIISKDGSLINIRNLSDAVDPRLTQAVMDVVGQWRHQPTLLNGEPVEVLTAIDVNFRLTD